MADMRDRLADPLPGQPVDGPAERRRTQMAPMEMSRAFALLHIDQRDDGEDGEKFTGVYSTRQNAKDASDRIAPAGTGR